MAKEKKKWFGFKRLFSKNQKSIHGGREHPEPTVQRTRPLEIFVIEPTKEETIVVDSKSKEVFVIEPAQGETFILEPTEEEVQEFKSENVSNDIFVIEPTKEYKILGLESDATDAELKARYRELLKQYHPDMGGDPKKFIEIRKAYVKIRESRE